MLSKDAVAISQMLEDKEFRRPVIEELASKRPGPVRNTVELVTAMLIRKGIPHDRAELYANCYVIGIMFGLGLVAMKDEKVREGD